jgi:hypothetical protein
MAQQKTPGYQKIGMVWALVLENQDIVDLIRGTWDEAEAIRQRMERAFDKRVFGPFRCEDGIHTPASYVENVLDEYEDEEVSA